MVAAVYTPHPYHPEVFAQLHHIDEAYRSLEEKAVAKEMLGEVRSLFIRYGVHRTLGVMVLHKHFDMTPEEKLVEFGSVTTPWLVPEANGDSVFGGKVVPRSWAYSSGHLYPIEFGFNPPAVENFPKISFDQDFVRELYVLLVGLGIGDLVGLTVLGDGIHEAPHGVEKSKPWSLCGPLGAMRGWIILSCGLLVSVGSVKVVSDAFNLREVMDAGFKLEVLTHFYI